MIAKVFKYEIIQTLPITCLKNFKQHKRLRVFYHKGVKCVSCKIKGSILGLGRDKRGNLHWDVYDHKFRPLTVDHIRPKSKGGSNDLVNLQPMCVYCNTQKGNKWEEPMH